jgi:hypothetical protein
VLETTRELIGRLEKAKSAPEAVAELKQWMDSLPAISKANRFSQTAINQAAARGLITETSTRLNGQPVDNVLNSLRSSEKALAASKPAL